MDVPNSIFKGSAGLVMLAAISLMPFHDDWQFELTVSCPVEKAKHCQQIFVGCVSLQRINLNPVTGMPTSSIGSGLAVSECLESRYRPICQEACGYPKDTGSWWKRFQRLGPWYLKFFPGVSSYWREYFGNQKADIQTF